MVTFNNQEQFIPEWRKEVELISHFLGNVTELGIHHLLIDKPEIFEKIHNYTECIEKHRNDIKKFRYLLDAVVKNKFIENGLLPCKDYFRVEYFINIVNIQLTSIINGHIKKNIDIEKLKKQLKVEVKNNKGELWLTDFFIGKGNETDRRNIENMINELPSNNLILRGLKDIYQNARLIEDESLQLRNEIGKIIGNIDNRTYKTLTTCCPTQDASIWEYPKKNSE